MIQRRTKHQGNSGETTQLYRLIGLYCALGIVATSSVLGQISSRSIMLREPVERHATGNLRIDLFGRTDLAAIPYVAAPEGDALHSRKSPYIAAGLSLVVPGAGQFYTERYWEAAAFLAADVVAWVLAYHYDQKGDKQTDFFQSYADAHWSVVDYANYALDNLVAPGNQSYYRTRLFIPGTENRPPWHQVSWGILNAMEREIGSTEAGRYYSHTLPLHGEQQYYELIGKYGQFNQGWDDRPPTYQYLDPVTARFTYYSIERGKANNYYNTASTWVTVAIVNHVVNAIYAGLSAGWYNNAHAELGLQRVPGEGGYANVPVVKVRWAF